MAVRLLMPFSMGSLMKRMTCSEMFQTSTFRWKHSTTLQCNKRTISLLLSHTKRQNYHSTRLYQTDTNISKDVTLYHYERAGYYRRLGVFGVAQVVFWVYLAHLTYTTWRPGTPESTQKDTAREGTPKDTFMRRRLESMSGYVTGNKWRNAVIGICLAAGSAITFLCFLFPLRAVNRVVLQRGGQHVQFLTYAPFGTTRAFTVPLAHVSAAVGRGGTPSQIPVKIKGHRFFYVLDKQGKISNTRLFDFTIGVSRNF
ncbi:PREDICTED: transmembrane protein 223-like [Branchiostoma belcheri]|uniref:Transmembrane protein 223-like n=1 Tax=Branchiostoma belcheri TaxID=7741 RepID=A0A6P5A3Q5_BRABE|nr:PREDICTED: transmembrane protein 223-like [Branchiostoma belcheri]XP_019647881.1 PREDICTED: transmembrane protein 223-like [Branchiostoma belcheri]